MTKQTSLESEWESYLDRRIAALERQVDEIIRTMGVDVSRSGRFLFGSARFRTATDAYQRLLMAEAKLGPSSAAWRDARSEGKSGAQLMTLLDGLIRELILKGEARPLSH